MADANALREKQQLPEAKAAIDKALALTGISGEQKQDAYMAKTECCFGQGDFVVAFTAEKRNEAPPILTRPSSSRRSSSDSSRWPSAQVAIVKLKVELAEPEGAESAAKRSTR